MPAPCRAFLTTSFALALAAFSRAALVLQAPGAPVAAGEPFTLELIETNPSAAACAVTAPDSLALAVRDSTGRTGTVTFGAEASGNARQLRFPATCRRALPILDTASAWTLAANGRPRLLDSGGKEVLGFQGGTRESGLDGRGSDGKNYRLAARGHPRAAAMRPPDATAAAATAAQRATPVDPATAPNFFSRHDEGGYSFVHKQPTTEEEIAQCTEAMEGCPVEAIGNDGE